MKAVENKPEAVGTGPQKAAKRRKIEVTSEEENESEKENEIEEDYLKKRERNIKTNKEMLLSLGMVPCLEDQDWVVVARAWFPPDLASKLTLGRVTKELTVLGVKRPQKCGLKDSLVMLAKELLRTKRVTIKKCSNLTRVDVIKT